MKLHNILMVVIKGFPVYDKGMLPKTRASINLRVTNNIFYNLCDNVQKKKKKKKKKNLTLKNTQL